LNNIIGTYNLFKPQKQIKSISVGVGAPGGGVM
jgi:hypothetical protein